MTTTEIIAWQQHAPAIGRQVERFCRRYGIDLDDCQSIAHEAFLKAIRSHDPARGRLLPRLHAIVHFDLLKHLKRREGYGRGDWHERQITPERTNTPAAALDRPAPGRQHWLTDFLDGLSQDARLVAGAVLDAPTELLYEMGWQPDGEVWQRHGVFRWLRGLGWAAVRISETFKEIREALA